MDVAPNSFWDSSETYALILVRAHVTKAPTNSALPPPLPSNAGHWTRKRSTKGSKIFPLKLKLLTRAHDSMKMVLIWPECCQFDSLFGSFLTFSPDVDEEGPLKPKKSKIRDAKTTHTPVPGPLVRIRSGYPGFRTRDGCCGGSFF